jgi:uncharacterized protein (DUF1015 family)
MLRVSPFRAVRPVPSKAAAVASVPYDVVNTAEARALAKGNPLSFLHVSRAEIDLPDTVDPHDDSVYARSRDNLLKLIRDGVMQQDSQPTMFLYRQVMNHRQQTGIVCCCHIDDYANDIIKKHEKTRKDKEDDRTRHLLELNAHTEPVFLTYRDSKAVAALVDRDNNERPMYHFNAPDGVTHTVWPVRETAGYVEAFRQVPGAYVADGHHRSASAARAGAERRDANPKHTGQEEYNWFLTVLFPASELSILSYNRVVRDLADQSPGQVRKRLEQGGTMTPTVQTQPDRPGVFCVYLQDRWFRLELDEKSIDRSDPIGSLDVSLLQSRVLEPILGIGDPRTDQRLDFVGGIRGTKELEQRVQRGEAAIAFSMFPTTMAQLLAVSDAGKIMPPKSTWFEPKLRSGLFVHMLD